MNYAALDSDIIIAEDGYWVWWPTGNHGAHNEVSLEIIIQILTALNAEVDRRFGQPHYGHDHDQQ